MNTSFLFKIFIVTFVMILLNMESILFCSEHKGFTINSTQLVKSINLSANYLNRFCDENGKFTYQINLNPKVKTKSKYNMLRHAGTIYALATHVQLYFNKDERDACIRAARFLREETLAPIPEREDLLAVWSYPKITKIHKPVQAKLGGTGLGLIALLSIEKIQPGTTSLDDLRKMGRFLLFMQKKDGSFYSKYVPIKGGRSDKWTSLYYPGESALGLIMLYEKDPSPQWLQAAANAIAYLARSRSSKQKVPSDHWALLATAKLLPLYNRCKQSLPRKSILQHAIQICESILANRKQFTMDSNKYGAMTKDAATCKTATRLEGLLAALTFLPAENRFLRERITTAVNEGISFILRSQIVAGKYAGGIPHTIVSLPTVHPQFTKSFNKRATKVRIDYVQHALSAMMQYHQMFFMSNPKGP